MNRIILAGLLAAALTPCFAESVTIDSKEYTINTISRRDIGPGTTWTRLRLPQYPLNVNIVTMDMTNPYNKVETMQGAETVGKTESIVGASKRLSTEGHHVIAGANGNFWCVGGQAPWSDLLVGTPYGGSVRNGKIVTETNAAADQWCGGPEQTCVIGSDDTRLWIEPMLWRGSISSDVIGQLPVTQANKVVRAGEIGIYNSFYDSLKPFQPVNQVGSHYVISEGASTEVYLTVDEGQRWNTGGDMIATVKEVKTDAGRGTRGSYDFVIVAHGGQYQQTLAKLKPDDKVTFNNGWTSYATGVTPAIENMLQGLSLVMKDGVIDPNTNQGNSYNNQIYPKTGYGSSADYKTLYIITIDKSTDPVYGASAGCPSHVMCEILKHYGCVHAATVDAGGSTEMLVLGNVVNRTTEGDPRPIANGWLVVSTAPSDDKITRLEFYDYDLKAPVYSSASPRIMAYNQYGDLLDDNLEGVVFSCDASVGTCAGANFTAGGKPVKGTLTATYGDVSVAKEIEVIDAELAIRIKPIVIDAVRTYPIEVTSEVDGNVYAYNPADILWTVDTPEIVEINSDGILRGLKNGTVEVTGSIGDFKDMTTVSVEIAATPTLPVDGGAIDTSTWKTSTTGTKVTSFTALGDESGLSVDYNITSARGPKVTVAKDIVLYSLPDAIVFDFKAEGAMLPTEATLTLKPANAKTAVKQVKTIVYDESGHAAMSFDVADFGDTSDLAFYPLTFKSIAFSGITKTGSYHLEISSLLAKYNNYGTNGVEPIVVGCDDTEGTPQYFTLQGVRVNGDNLTTGIYIVRRGNKVEKILIK